MSVWQYLFNLCTWRIKMKCYWEETSIHSFVMRSYPQPARLNVFKNDQDTWDYTNPNLSGQGKMQSPTPSFSHFASFFPLMPLYGMVRVLCLLGYCLWSHMNGFFTVHHAAQLCVHRQYSCNAFTVFTLQAQSKGMRSNLIGSQPQLQAYACKKPNAHVTVAYVGAPLFS